MSSFYAGTETALAGGIIGRRVIAALIDAVILGLTLAVLHSLLWVLGFLTFGFGWYLAGGLWVVPIVYVTVFIASPGQATPGQAWQRLCVARDDDLGAPTPAQALVYAVGFEISLWLGAFWLLAALFTRRSRCLHDIAAGVVVVRREALTAPPAAWKMPTGPGPT